MTSQTGQQIITIHILPNISRSKDNQAMKFVDIIEFNVKNIFLERSCKKGGKEISLDLFFLFYKSFI